jgi:hypothetical protein
MSYAGSWGPVQYAPARTPALPAHDKRITPQVLAVELDQVEGIEEHIGVMAPILNGIERRNAIITARHRLSIDDARPRVQLGQRLDNEREAVGQVIARPAVERAGE